MRVRYALATHAAPGLTDTRVLFQLLGVRTFPALGFGVVEKKRMNFNLVFIFVLKPLVAASVEKTRSLFEDHMKRCNYEPITRCRMSIQTVYDVF